MENLLLNTLMSFYIFILLTYWLCDSLIVELFVSVILIMMSSLMTYFMYDSPWSFYIITLSVVGGFMVLLSFTIMSLPNYSTHTVSKVHEMIINTVISLSIIFIIVLMMKLVESPEMNMIEFMDRTMKSLNMIIFPFIMDLIFLLVILIMMLLVIDSIVISKSGSAMFFESTE